jgi:hypothetical protein
MDVVAKGAWLIEREEHRAKVAPSIPKTVGTLASSTVLLVNGSLVLTFRVATRLMMPTVKPVDSREACYWSSHTCSLEASRRVIQIIQ